MNDSQHHPGNESKSENSTPIESREDGSETTQERWPIEALVALLESGRAELRLFRSLFYGNLAAAFLIPIGTIGINHTDFLHLGCGVFAGAVIILWVIGIILLIRGLWGIGPRLSIQFGILTEVDILTQIEDALDSSPHRDLLIESIEKQHELLREVGMSREPFSWAMVFFLLCVAAEFIGFITFQVVNQ